ncbi:uncharacterized protein BP5553_04624 [Venustampulla echinocandica]|uniref:SET domain-containing protein n=1 Tax=Venustampulla echinocandica TaxID=2656787 RepID=A0A370TNU8_9HELO|nr:uncharacterized protein BP5553_04624 [Venustampulla echinocandica]RDL37191.1 hypothetical protein BP5553_04624 [Venustampulla echinocandica]
MMERSWEFGAWRPTISPSQMNWKAPEVKEVQELRDILIDQAKDVVDKTYLPSVWARRGKTLLILGYPELSAADAYKAIRLCDAGLCHDSTTGLKVRLIVGMWIMLQSSELSSWTASTPARECQRRVADRLKDDRNEAYKLLLSALRYTQDNREAVNVCHEAQMLYPHDLAFAETLAAIQKRIRSREGALKKSGMTAADIEAQMRVGCIRFKQYPWMSPSLLRRSPDLVSACNAALESYSTCIEMKESSIGESGTAANNDNSTKCFGYFATRDIQAGELVLAAPTALGVYNRQTTARCYNCSKNLNPSYVAGFPCCSAIRFCSSECRRIAEETYHKILCGKDFGVIYKDAERACDTEDPAINVLFWLRLLACCVQEGGHPLEMPQMARLVAQYGTDINVGWSLRANVVGPLQILESFGVDIFADARYESWVLETMWHRVKNNYNSMGINGELFVYLNEHYSGFNHSCHSPPMVAARSMISTAELGAMRYIRKGEEVLTTYLGREKLAAPKEMQVSWGLEKAEAKDVGPLISQSISF